MDNFYTNLSLFGALLDRQTYACGTITVNHGEFPQWLKTEKLNAGDETYIWNDDIFLAVHWKGKRNVFVLSSFRGNFAKVIERYCGNVVKPDCFSAYSQHMGGVDKCDQLLSNYAISKKSIKWWKKVFSWLLELCVINSMCLFFEKNPESGRKRNNHKRYQEMLIHKLVLPLLHKGNNNEPLTNMGCPSQANKRSRINVEYDIHLRGRHYVTKKHPRRKCTICGYKKNQQTHTKLLWKMSKTYLWRQFPSLPYSKPIIKMFFTICLKAYYIPSDIDHIISFQKYWGLACDLFCCFCSVFFHNWSLACGLFVFFP